MRKMSSKVAVELISKITEKGVFEIRKGNFSKNYYLFKVSGVGLYGELRSFGKNYRELEEVMDIKGLI